MHGLLHQVADGIRKAKDEANQASRDKLHEYLADAPVKYCDLHIQFIGADGLPKMDVIGSADPYFVAKLDNHLTYTSAVQVDTLKPVWNEIWKVNNVPSTASLTVEVFDKDEGAPADDYIGKFTTSISAGTKECEIRGSLGSFMGKRGIFWLKISSAPASNPSGQTYVFDGPVRFTVHKSPIVGRLVSVNQERLYSTWKMHLKGVANFFGNTFQPWNRNYKAAQAIFQGPASIAVRSTIQAGHRMLYARSTRNGFGTVETPQDTFNLLRGGKGSMGHRIKPAVYTYIVASEDDTFRFSETGAAFFVDFASKHALHSNCSETVRYSGEFHPRPKGGWAVFNDTVNDEDTAWELVIDNNSGTYSPDKAMLPALKMLLEYNFPGFEIYALDHEDAGLTSSRESCREYALKYRGVQQNELQPTAQEGDETLSHRASVKRPSEVLEHDI